MRRWGEREKGRRGERETGRKGDGEKGRKGEREKGRRGDSLLIRVPARGMDPGWFKLKEIGISESDSR